MNAIAAQYPCLTGGAADLAPSTKTRLNFEAAGDFQAHAYGGRDLHFGIANTPRGAILNRLALSNIQACGWMLLIFSDDMKPSIHLAALMELPVIYISTHDSIGLGQDGPTHQPVEQLIALRTIPGLITLRPGDAHEVVEAWRVIVGLTDRPACLVLSHQALPTLDRAQYAPAAGVSRGAYVLAGPITEATVDHLDPIFAALAPGLGDIPRTPGREKGDPRAERGYIHAGPSPALYARFRSRQAHSFGEKMLSTMRSGFGGHIEGQESIDPEPKPAARSRT